MKKMSTKVLSFVLAVIFVTGLLTACSSGSKVANDNTTQEPASTTATANNDTQKQGPAEDFTSEVTKYTLMAPLFGDLPDISDEELYKMIREQTGIDWDVTWVSSSDYTTKFQTVLASGDITDVIVTTNLLDTTLNKCIKDGYFADLTDYLGDFSKYPNLINNETKNAFNYVTSSDKRIMAIPRSRADLEMVIYMRKDWMDKLGYTVDQIKTVDDWKNMVVDISKKDPDGNSKADTLGYAAWGYNLGDGYLTDIMSSAFGAYNGQKDEAGGLYYPNLTDGFVDYIEFANKMYKEGAVSKEFSVLGLSEASDMFNAGLAASYVRTGTWGWGYEKNLKENLGLADAEVIALPYLKGTGDNTTATRTTGVYGAYYLNSELEDYDIKKLLNFYEYTCNEEWHTYAFYGMEGRDYTVDANGSKVATEYGANNVMKYQSLQQVVTTIANTEMKLVSTSAPKEFNDKIKAAALTYTEPAANIKLNHFRAINSDSWAKVWPLYQKTYEENTVMAIVGSMNMDEYRKYISDLRAQDDMKKCWQEFAAHDAQLFPDGY